MKKFQEWADLLHIEFAILIFLIYEMKSYMQWVFGGENLPYLSDVALSPTPYDQAYSSATAMLLSIWASLFIV